MNKQLAIDFGQEVKDEYPKANAIDISEAIRDVDDAMYSRVMAEIKKTPHGYTVNARDVAKAIDASGANQSEAIHYATQSWICQACKTVFNFRQMVTNDMPYLGIHAACPQCNFIPQVILTIQGNEIHYKGNSDIIKLFSEVAKVKDEDAEEVSVMDYYRRKRRPCFNSALDRESEFAAMKIKGLLPEKENIG